MSHHYSIASLSLDYRLRNSLYNQHKIIYLTLGLAAIHSRDIAALYQEVLLKR